MCILGKSLGGGPTVRQGTAIRLQEGEQLQCKDVNVRDLSVILAVFSTANAKDELYETKWLVFSREAGSCLI